MVYGYMFYWTSISNITFKNSLAFTSAIFKESGHQYKSNNISKPTSHRAVKVMILDSLDIAIYKNVHLTFTYIHTSAIYKDGVQLSHLSIA